MTTHRRRARGLGLLGFGIVACALVATGARAGGQGPHLVISEIGYDTVNEGAGASSEYVEIFNPTDHAIDLSNYYLSDDPRSYALVADFNYSTTGNPILLPTNSDFIHRFPDGLTIPSGGIVVVCADAQTFLDEFFGGSLVAFHAQPGYPQLVQANQSGLSSVAKMRPVATNSSQTMRPIDGLNLTNSGEIVILFTWDQTADLIQDVDAVAWGAALGRTPPINLDKDNDFAAGVDGPDADSAATMFKPDAGAPASFAAARVREGNAIVRTSLTESQERTSGGNGIGGHDESSEDWSVFSEEAASPGVAQLGTPELRLAPGDLDFGRVASGNGATLDLVFENTGFRDLVVSNLQLGGADASAFTIDTSDLRVAPGASERRSVRFQPGALRRFGATLGFSTNDPARGSVTIALSGEGASPPVIAVRTPGQTSGASGGQGALRLAFPPTRKTQSHALTIVITNSGGADLHVQGLAIAGAQALDFSVDTAAATVRAGATLNREVRFAPTGEGRREARLTITSDDPNSPSIDIALTGEGLPAPAPRAELLTDGIAFGHVPVGEHKRARVAIRNDGSAALEITRVEIAGADAAQFEAPSAMPISIPIGETHTLRVVYRPQQTGAHTAAFRIETNDPQASTLVVSVNGTSLEPLGARRGGGGCRLGANGDASGIAPIALALLALAALGRARRRAHPLKGATTP